MGQLLLSHQAPHGPGNHHAQHAGSGPEPEFAISLGVEVAIQGDRWGGGRVVGAVQWCVASDRMVDGDAWKGQARSGQ